MSLIRNSLLLLTLVAVPFVTGCQSAAPATAEMPASKAVLITTGQGTSVVLVPNGSGGVTALASAKAEKCSQCEADVAAYFKSGSLAPKCAACGSTRTVLTGTN